MEHKLNEERVQGQILQSAEYYFNKYKSLMESLESRSPISKVRSITPYDYYALGKMLENFETMVAMTEADGSIADLGILPKIGLDVITVAYGASPVGVFASVQPISEEQGTVYYKAIKAGDTAGNLTAGNTIVGAQSPMTTPSGYAAGLQTENLGTGNGTTTSFTGTLSYLPIRPNSLTVTAGAVTGSDDGAGNIVGNGVSGTVDYNTGAITVTFTTAPATGVSVDVTYIQNLESATQIRTINYELTSKSIRAYPYALRSTVGLLKSFALKQRFGVIAEDEVAVDLVNAINAEVSGDLIRLMNSHAQGTVQFQSAVPSGISESEHRASFKFRIADAENNITTNAGRGTVNFIIAGSTVATIISTLEGFKKLYDGNSVGGAVIFGTLDGVPVVKVNDANILASTDALCGFKGSSVFDAAAVYAPYMPLTTTDLLPTSNPLVNQKAAALMAGRDVLVPNFITKIQVV